MIQIVVMLEGQDRESFKQFENTALEVMTEHGGKLISAFEPDPVESSPSHVAEVHVIQFPSIEALRNYRVDSRLTERSWLRNKAISNTTVYVSGKMLRSGEHNT